MKRDVAVILSVDDDPDIRDLISITLKGEGYDVVMASDGASGLAAATVSRPDLILLDYMMPGMNGVEVCARLQDSPVTSHIPVVFLTAVTGEVERSRAFALGAVDYLIKPLDPAILKEAVSRHLATAGSFEQMSDQHEDTTLSSRIGPGAFPAFRDSLPDRFGLGRESAAFLGAMTPATMYVVAARLGISSADMAAAVSDALGIGLVTQIPAREVRLGVLPAPFSKSNLVVPVRNAVVGDAFVLSNPFNWDLLETLERTAGTGEDPNVLVAAPETVLAVFEAALEQVRRRIEIEPALSARPIDAMSAENRPVTAVTDDVLAHAFGANAEDLVIDPGAARADVRLKVGGDLRDMVGVSAERAAMMISRIKALAGMDIAEKRRPQRGSLEVGFGKDEYDLIVATALTQYGESLTCRIIPVGRPPRTLSELGMSAEQVRLATSFLEAPRGLILIAGPSGSGKTTTAHSLLSGAASASRLILSIEDPIEYRIPFATQQQVDDRAGVTTAALLRSAVRRGADVLFLGEITGAESAMAALEYSRSNGLLVATIQASDAMGALGKLEEWGVPRPMMSEALRGIIGQRLLSLPCAACRSFEPPTEAESAMLAPYVTQVPQMVVRSSGCPVCAGTGRHGRVGVFEVAPLGPVLTAALRSEMPWVDIRIAVGQREGLPMSQAVLRKVIDMILTPDDAVRSLLWEAGDAAKLTREVQRSASAVPAKVLVVDDSEDNRDFMTSVLESQGWEVSAARNGVEALGFLKMNEYDLVVSDLNMPLMGGFDLFERATHGDSAPPAILYSASSDDRDEIRSLKMGAADYIRLPVSPEVLRLRSKRALGRS